MSGPYISDRDREAAKRLYETFDDERFLEHGQRLYDQLQPSTWSNYSRRRPGPPELAWTREALRRGLLFDPKPTERIQVQAEVIR